MSDEQPFRVALMIICGVILPIGLYHRIKSFAGGDRLDRRQEGLFILLTLRPFGLSCLVAVVAYMINPAAMAWAAVPLPGWVRWIGVLTGAAVIALFFWTLTSLGKNLTDTVVTRKNHTLVTAGPYRWVRHPFYDCVVLLGLTTSLLTANWFIFLTSIVVFSLMVLRTRTEEANLVARFGDSYRTYMQRTGRFLPGVGVTRPMNEA